MPDTAQGRAEIALPASALVEMEIDYGRRLLRESGNPFPFIAAQWPELLVTDRAEARFFAGGQADPLDPCLRLDAWQRDLIRSAFQPGYKTIFIKGCTGAGKGGSIGLLINVWFDAFNPCKVIVNSSDHEHAKTVMFAEAVKWRQRMRRPGAGVIQTEGFVVHSQKYLKLANPKTREGFSGHHGENNLFVFDEASATEDAFFDQAMTQCRLLVAPANPATMGGFFRRAFPKDSPDTTQTVKTAYGLSRVITVGGPDCTNVREKRLEKPIGPPGGMEIAGTRYAAGDYLPPDVYARVKPIIPGQLCYDKFLGIMANPDARWGRVMGLGKFPEEDPVTQLIFPSWLWAHEQAWHERIAVEGFSLDVAASEYGDDNVLAAGGLEGVRALHEWKERDTMQTVSRVIQIAQEIYGVALKAGRIPVMVDQVGVGCGVRDRLRELGVRVVTMGGRAIHKDAYFNRRAEVYGELARRLDPLGMWSAKPWALPAKSSAMQMLREELCAPEKIYDSDGLKFKITPKERKPGSSFRGDTLKEKLGRSPDRADAVVGLYQLVWRRAIKQVPRLHRDLIGYPYVEPRAMQLDERQPAGGATQASAPEAVSDRPIDARRAALDSVLQDLDRESDD